MKTTVQKTILAFLVMMVIAITGATCVFAAKSDSKPKVTTQPVSVTVSSGSTAKVSFSATGTGLTYKWYYKNKGASKFSLTTSFTGKTYSVKMNKSRAGRQVYCKIVDKYGNSVKTNTVTLSMGKTLAIKKQLKSVTATEGTTAKVSFTASGSGLSYKWYYKNKGASNFSRTTTFKGNTYKAEMTAARDGRQVYCVVTDKYGSKVQTKTVTLTMAHPYDAGVETRPATCSKVGKMLYTCTLCGHEKTENIAKLAHQLGDWTTYRAATPERVGTERRSCENCSYYQDRTVAKIKATHYITLHLGAGKPTKVGVGTNGVYDLKVPYKSGHVFKGWQDANGEAFAEKGTIFSGADVYAVWEVADTTDLTTLLSRVEAGVENVKIAADITVNQPIYVTHNVKIFSDGDFTLKRDPKYKGDIFVVGQDKNGNKAVNLRRDAVLTLGGGEGLLTIDGNKETTTVDVVGSAVFVADSSVLNLYDGVRITNHKKVGNDRINRYTGIVGATAMQRAGGAAVLNLSSTVNMYGGILDKNVIATDYTVIKNAEGVDEKKEVAGCGGAIFNQGNLNMYGGVISDNEALRGGGIYNDRIAYLFAGTVADNISHSYGGGLSSSSSSNADLFIGSEKQDGKMVFSGNHSKTGGAVYSNTWSPIVIYGNTEFIDNETESSGGAIYTAGPLTVWDATFRNNTCVYSGGAIYHQYGSVGYDRRYLKLNDCVFEGNNASLGGAIVLSAASSMEVGTHATITDCQFKGNRSVAYGTNPGNAGAVYVTRKSEAIISGCSFEQNVAANTGGGIGIQSSAKVQLSDSTFTENSALAGGGLYAISNTKVDLKDLTFTGNSATGNSGNGGGIYVSDAELTLDNVDFYNNTATNNAGALYQGYSHLKLDSTCEFAGNSANGHGGAIYMTYKTVEGKKTGSTLDVKGVTFKDNTALAGGAVSVRSACELTLSDATLQNNSATGTGNDASGGGAIYVGFGSLTMDNVTTTGNTSAGYGGAVTAVSANVNVTGGSFERNSAPAGGALNAITNCALSFKDVKFIENESTYENTDYNNKLGGGAINTDGGTLSLVHTTLDGNASGYYAGAIRASKAEVSISEGSVLNGSKGATGAGLYFVNSSKVTIDDLTVSKNVSTGNGIIYANSSQVDITNIDASENSAYNGGVFYVSGGSAVIKVSDSAFTDNTAKNEGGVIYCSNAKVEFSDDTFTGNSGANGGVLFGKDAPITLARIEGNNNTATKNGGVINTSNATIEVTDASFAENHSNGTAGAAYIKLGTGTLKNVTFNKNSANTNGGALNTVGATVTVDSACSFTENTAKNHGGAAYVVYTDIETETGKQRYNSLMTMDGGKFESNSALGGGAVSIRTGCEADFNGTIFTNNAVTGFADENDGDGEGGGAIYVGYGALKLTNVTATDNTASDFGGAVDAVKGDVTVTGGKYENNTAGSGGAIYAMSKSTITIDGTTFSKNTSTFQNGVDGVYNSVMGGGAVNINTGTLTVTGTTISENTSKYYGGAIHAIKATVNLSNSTVSGSTGATGAALYFRDGCTAEMKDMTLTENTSTGNGVIYAASGTTKMDNVSASGNTAYAGGVYFASSGNKGEIKNSTWKQNTATNGGALYVNSDNVVVEVWDSEMSENTAQLGGAAYVSLGQLKTHDTLFTKNKAIKNKDDKNGNGGAISLSGGNLFTTEKDVFTENEAAGHGGAVYVAYFTNKDNTRVVGKMTAEGTLFENNKAGAGGAISSRTGSIVALNGAVLQNNTASTTSSGEGAGAIFTNNNTLTLTDVTLKGNTSAGHGGAINSLSAEVTISNSTFESNTATGGDGGAMRVADTTTLNMTDVTFKNNTAKGKGGALTTDTDSPDLVINATNCIFNKNTSTTAGAGALEIQNKNCPTAAAPEKAKLVFTNCSFTENSAKTTGGAIEVRTSSYAKFDGITITDNVSQQNGAGIYVTSNHSRVYLTGNVVSSNNVSKESGDSFVHLYNNNYSNAPRIYTTDSSSVAWASQISGNKTCITFDLTTLP